MLEELVMGENDRISELILASLTQLTNKVDDITTKLAKMEAVIENSEKRHSNLEIKLDSELKEIENKLSLVTTRVVELETYKSNMQSRIVVIGSIVTFLFTIGWSLMNSFVIPAIIG